MPDYTGSYAGGATAARLDVRVSLADSGLELKREDGSVLAVWPYDELKLVEEVLRNQPIRLKSETDPDARLSLSDHAILEPLLARAPGIARQKASWRRRWLFIGAWSVGAAALVLVIVFVLPLLASVFAKLIPKGWEQRVGSQAVEQLVGMFARSGDKSPFCTEPSGKAVLDRAVGRLASTVETPYSFNVRVANVPAVNAFAVPGGHIVLFKGLVDEAQSPEEVLGVLAHEMAHVVERHPTEGMIRALGLAILFDLIAGDVSGTGTVAGVAEMLVYLSYTREAEAEADRTGLAMLGKANIRADGLVRFFERLAAKHPEDEGALALLATHPSDASRAEAAKAAAGGGGPGLTADEWRALKGICAGERTAQESVIRVSSAETRR